MTVKKLLPICMASLLLVACGGSTDSKKTDMTPAPTTSATATPTSTSAKPSAIPTSTPTQKASSSAPVPAAPKVTAATKIEEAPAAPAKVQEERPPANQPQGFYAPAPAEEKAPVPAPAQASAPAPAQQAPVGGNIVHPGAFCSGGTGVTSKGTPMVCGPGKDGKNRWKAA